MNFDELKKEFEKYSDENKAKTLIQQSEKTVVTRSYSTGPTKNLLPFEFQILGLDEGTPLDKKPKSMKNKYMYGVDASNNIVSIVEGTDIKNLFYTECFFHNPDHILSYRFNEFEIVNVTHTSVEKGKVSNSLRYGEYGLSQQKYIYKDDVLVQIDVREKEHEEPDFQGHSLLFEYTSDNLSRIVLKASNGYTRTVYPG